MMFLFKFNAVQCENAVQPPPFFHSRVKVASYHDVNSLIWWDHPITKQRSVHSLFDMIGLLQVSVVALLGLACSRLCASFVFFPGVIPTGFSLPRFRLCKSHLHYRISNALPSSRTCPPRLYSSDGSSSGEGDASTDSAPGQQVVEKSKAEQDSDAFDWLASNSGTNKMVSLGVTAGGYRGLLASCDIQQGQASLGSKSI